jgi:hypothetical protein
MIKEGESIEKIKKYTKLDENKILELIKQIGSEKASIDLMQTYGCFFIY